ncbi:MAG: hypothetical protein K5637_01985 [Lachnospiraceae bacterium]|nr:hypothetical protein [Lachnospiraceae bacterium]
MAYRYYITDGIKALLDSLSNQFGGASLVERYADLVNKPAKPEDPRTAEEIISDITSGLARLRKEDSEDNAERI